MRLFVPARRATLLVPSGPADDPQRKHLFILLTDPQGPTGEVLMVSISSVREGLPHDPTCLLYPGDHPFIRRESFVDYSRTRLESAEKLLRGVRDGTLDPREVIEDGVVARVCKGLMESRQTRPRIRAFFQRAAGRA